MAIKVLDRTTVSRIAAGEVVERPESVVKELVENALDAGATQIAVESRDGGASLIRVVDNGCGIPPDEVALAFERHATSKITSDQDLHGIATLGFRGEALPSIAAVAAVEMVTCSGEGDGAFIAVDNGEVTGHGGRGRARGTTVTVRELFRKVPARLKFLKSPQTENNHIARVVTQYALAYPEVRFSLTIEGRPSLQTPGSGRLIDAAVEVYGAETARAMLPVPDEVTDFTPVRVAGLVGTPSVSRSSRDGLSFFVNRRWVNSGILARAVEEAYHGLLMEGRRPTVILDITVPAGEIDVNIHPAKTEVRFRNERAVFAAVQKAVRQTLVSQATVPRIEDSTATYGATAILRTPAPTPLTLQLPPRQVPLDPATPPGSLPMLRVLGQLSASYIVAEGPDGLYLIDQHAAHERVCFEKVMSQQNGQAEAQGLLEPAAVEMATGVSPEPDLLAQIGFTVEPFGERTLLVRTVPRMLADADWRGALQEILGIPGAAADRLDRMAKSLACHGAVRAGQALTLEEMREMVRQLEQTALPNTCPHGRPTIIRLSRSRLEREFGRG